MERDKILRLNLSVLSIPSSQPMFIEYKLCQAPCPEGRKGGRTFTGSVSQLGRIVVFAFGGRGLINTLLMKSSLMSSYTETSAAHGTPCGIFLNSTTAVSNHNPDCCLVPDAHKVTREASSGWHGLISGWVPALREHPGLYTEP